MDVIEAPRRIRQLPGGGGVKIVAVTASAFKEQRQEMLDAGMDDFVRKPYRFNEIHDSLARCLGVEFIRRATPPSAWEGAHVALTQAMLAALPLSLRSELKGALESLDINRIQAALVEIRVTDPHLAVILTRLAERFDYPAILHALVL